MATKRKPKATPAAPAAPHACPACGAALRIVADTAASALPSVTPAPAVRSLAALPPLRPAHLGAPPTLQELAAMIPARFDDEDET